VFFAAATGAAFGLLSAVILAFTVGILDVPGSPFLLTLWPTSTIGLTDLGAPPEITRFLIPESMVANALLFGFVFAIPLRSVLAVRRSLGTGEKPTSIGRI
jgi:hypothetical protein